MGAHVSARSVWQTRFMCNAWHFFCRSLSLFYVTRLRIVNPNHMKIYTNVCVQLCAACNERLSGNGKEIMLTHNGNLLFMTTLSLSHSVSPFFSSGSFFLCSLHYDCCGVVVCFLCGYEKRISGTSVSHSQWGLFYSSSLRRWRLLLFYWSSNCKDSNECYYLTASWMKPKSRCYTHSNEL